MKYRLMIILGLCLLMLHVPSIVSAQDTTLTILWHDSDACSVLDTLTDSYPDATITVDCVAGYRWQDEVYYDFATRSGADLIVLDTQFQGVAVGHMLDLNTEQGRLQLGNFPATLLNLHRTQNNLVTLPLLPDTRILAYRSDIYAATGYSAPQSWTELVRQSQFMAGSSRIDYGFASSWSRIDGHVLSTWNHILWSEGGALFDTSNVNATINSTSALNAIDIATALWETAPPQAITFTPDDVVDAICSGTTAVVEIWSSDAPVLTNSSTCGQAGNIAFASVPSGQSGHYTSYNGAGIGVSNYSQNQSAAIDFLVWLTSVSIQERWVAAGQLSGHTALASAGNSGYKSVYVASLQIARDDWNNPQFGLMRLIQQYHLHRAIIGQSDAETALDTIQTQQQVALDRRN